MNRTYNAQVDNGLFVLAYYLNKSYKDLTMDDLKSSVDLFADKMYSSVSEDGKPAKTNWYSLSTQSHNNSFLNQYTRTRDKIYNQLKDLIDGIGQDKVCMCCGERLVNIKYENDAINAFLAGAPSTKNFFNKSNNLQTIDICNKCLYLSYISFLNTQKLGYAFLYLSDSDEFMEYITEELQLNWKTLDITLKQSDMDRHFIETMSEFISYEDIFDDMTYIDLIYFQNGKTNYYEEDTVPKEKIRFLLRLKKRGLINEFYNLKLFKPYLKDKFLMYYLVDRNKLEMKCGEKLYRELEEHSMTKKEIELIKYTTEKLLERDSAENILKDLKLCNKKSEFERFIKDRSKDVLVYDSLEDFIELTEGFYKYKSVLEANLLIKKNKGGC